MKKRIIITIIVFILFFQSEAQDYLRTVGIRNGNYSGITGRLMFNDQIALEGILGWRNHGLVISTLIEKYKPLPFYWADGFQYYYGFGAHFGTGGLDYLDQDRSNGVENNLYRRTVFVAGIDGIIGCEYNFAKIPFIIGLECKPYIETQNVRNVDMQLFEFALSIRYKLSF